MTVALPDGWQTWTPRQKERLLRLLEAAREPWSDWWAAGARPEQTPPLGAWFAWMVIAGRGFGKTRTGAEWAWRQAAASPGSRGALIAPTAADVRDVMVEGESGILACAPPEFRPRYEPSKRRLVYPNDALQFTYSADEPDRLRGPQHHYAWVDEWAAMRFAQDMLDMLLMGLRLGSDPRLLVTTTPRPIKPLRDLLAEATTVVTGGSTYDNLENLAPTFRERVVSRYEGTRLGRQELMAEILTDVEGALWRQDVLDAHRVREAPADLVRVVVGVDPAATAGEEADETGIVVVGLAADGAYYVLDDLSGRYDPNGWGSAVAEAYGRWMADAVVAEVNNGGDMVPFVIRTVDPSVKVRTVRASRGKAVRAEPISSLYEQGQVHHVGTLADLETQMTTWTPLDATSPDRLDALVWALTDLSARPMRAVRSIRT